MSEECHERHILVQILIERCSGEEQYFILALPYSQATCAAYITRLLADADYRSFTVTSVHKPTLVLTSGYK